MMKVTELYRYPVKGFTPETRTALQVDDAGRVVGDRVLAIRFASGQEPEDRDGLEYWPKRKGLALMTFPSLAAIRLRYDDESRVIELEFPGGAGLRRYSPSAASRTDLSSDLERYLRTSDIVSAGERRELDRRGRLPLCVVGDGVSSRFQDRPAGYVSLHGDQSVAAVADTTQAPVDSRRFRSNIVISGAAAWSELSWSGRVRIGETILRVVNPIARCLAIDANPDTGQRDVSLLPTLTADFGQETPTVGVLLLPDGRGGPIRVGDEVTVVG